MGNLMTEYVIKNKQGAVICRVEAGYEVRPGFTIQAIGGKQHEII